MEVGDERPDVAQGIRAPIGFLILFDMIDVASRPLVPLIDVPLIDAVDLAALWNPDVLMREEKFSEARIQGESVDFVTCGVNHHRAGTVDEIARRQLLGPALKAVFQRSVAQARRHPAM